MTREQLIELLNTLVRYDLEEIYRNYGSSSSLVADKWGENLKAEEVAKVFGLKFDCFKGFSE